MPQRVDRADQRRLHARAVQVHFEDRERLRDDERDERGDRERGDALDLRGAVAIEQRVAARAARDLAAAQTRFMQQCVAFVTGNQVVSLHGKGGVATAGRRVDGAGTRANLTKSVFRRCQCPGAR
jgi:hypothetical protein